jgi:CRP-like cAMP-binding protein
MAEHLPPGAPARNQLLASISPSDLGALAEHFQEISLKVPRAIYEAGAQIDYLYFPTSGLLSVVSNMSNGSTIEVAAVGKDGAIGANVLLGQERHSHRCFVQIDGTALRISVENLKSLVAERPQLEKHLLRYIGSLMVASMQGNACNGLHSVEPRCCRWLLMTHDRMTTDDMQLTHEFLAQMLGVRRASISEILKPLRDEGLLDYSRGTIKILDRKGIEARACECYRLIADEFSWLNQ